MSIDLSAKFYHDNKRKTAKKKLLKDTKVFLMKKKKKIHNIVVRESCKKTIKK